MNNLFENVQIKQFKVDKRSDKVKLLEGILKEFNFYSPQNFRGILFQTKNLTEKEIQSCYDKARQFKANPAALFRKLIKQKVEEIKVILSSESITPKPYTPLFGCKCDLCDYYRLHPVAQKITP